MTTLLETIAEMFSSGDVEIACAVFADHYRDHQKPEWIEFDGPAEFIAIVEGARASLPNLHVTVAAGPFEHADLEIGVLHWFSESDEGVVIERDTVETLRVEHGRVVEHWGAEIRNSAR